MMPPISYAENALLQASGVGHPVVGSSAGTSKLNIYLAQPQSSLGQEGKNMLQPCQTSCVVPFEIHIHTQCYPGQCFSSNGSSFEMSITEQDAVPQPPSTRKT